MTHTNTTTAYWGLADHSHQQHLVRDTNTWTAYCGKGIAEAWPVTADQVDAMTTCRSCRKSLRLNVAAR